MFHLRSNCSWHTSSVSSVATLHTQQQHADFINLLLQGHKRALYEVTPSLLPVLSILQSLQSICSAAGLCCSIISFCLSLKHPACRLSTWLPTDFIDQAAIICFF